MGGQFVSHNRKCVNFIVVQRQHMDGMALNDQDKNLDSRNERNR